VGIAYAIASFPSLIRDAGLTAILIQRQAHLKRWVAPAFWMSLALGLLSAVVMIAAAPFAAEIYHQKELVGLIGFVALSSLFGALGIVPSTLLYIQLRFRLQSMVQLVSAVATVVLNVLMAWRHFGAYSFVVPTVIVAAGRTAFVWWAAGYRVSPRLHIRRWRYLIGDSAVLLLSGALAMAISQGDYLILGKVRGQQVTGVFFFAFNLSWQALTLFTVSIAGILFSALAKLQSEPERLVQAYLRAARVLAVIGAPACLLQAAVANPGIHFFFKPKWYGAIPIVQVLSIAMAIRVVGIAWGALNTAQGRFKLQLVLNAVFCLIFLASVGVAASVPGGNGFTVACTEAVFFSIADPLALYIHLVRKGASPGREVFSVFAPPLGASAISVGVAWIIGLMIGSSRPYLLPKIAMVALVALGLYIPLIRQLAPKPWNELLRLALRKGAPLEKS
jgi:PST family polysaccharide transporter